MSRNGGEILFNRINELLAEVFKYSEKDDIMHVFKEWRSYKDNVSRAAVEYCFRKLLTLNGVSVLSRKFCDTEIDFYLQSMSLQGVIIENKGYSDIIKQYDSSKTFMLLDPPYYVNSVGNYYRCDSEFFYHREFANIVNNMKSKLLLTYNDSNYIRSLYPNLNYELIERIFVYNYFEVYFNNFKDGGIKDGTDTF